MTQTLTASLASQGLSFRVSLQYASPHSTTQLLCDEGITFNEKLGRRTDLKGNFLLERRLLGVYFYGTETLLLRRVVVVGV